MSAWTPTSFASIVVGDAVLLSRHLSPGRSRTDLVGRVLAHRPGEIMIEWIALYGETVHAPQPHSTKWLTVQDVELASPRYRPADSPTTRTYDAGERWLHGLLLDACGGHPERLSRCVDPAAGRRTELGVDARRRGGWRSRRRTTA